MSIHALSDSAVRAIGSSLVLNDAGSVVKELIDNALDARSTVVSIEISANTLDVIQVKDNGSGIGLEDRQLICKRGCTSKIRSIEDLERLGGTSLGFRGEALWSIAELSKHVLVTSRVDGEKIGSALKYGPAGALLRSSASASHPVGTTIRVQNFLQRIPVRKQTAEKNASKTLAAIKKLLYMYAFARPSVRFSLKVLKAQTEKMNWVYAGLSESTVQEAAVKIVGKDIAMHCEFRSTKGCELGDKEPDSAFVFNALLVRPTGDVSKSHNAGHYISIDGRPVSSGQSCVKEVIKLYRSYFRNAYQSKDDPGTPMDPFFFMHIRCPPGSYDVNIEPAKDDVLFLDPTVFISAAERLLLDFYGPLNINQGNREILNEGRNFAPKAKTFDLLLARKPNAASVSDTESQHNLGERGRQQQVSPGTQDQPDCLVAETVSRDSLCSISDHNIGNTQEKPENKTAKAFHSMYSLDEDDLPEIESLSPRHDGHNEEDNAQIAKVTNPWSLAKMNAPIRPKLVNPVGNRPPKDATEPITPTPSVHGSSPGTLLSPALHSQPLFGRKLLPTPSASPQRSDAYQNPAPPLQSWSPATRRQDRVEETALTQNPDASQQLPKRAVGLESWVKPSQQTVQLPSFQWASQIYNKDGRFGPPSSSQFDARPGSMDETSAPDQLVEADPLDIHQTVQSTRKSFKSPLKSHSTQSPPGANAESCAVDLFLIERTLQKTSSGMVGDQSRASHAHPSLEASQAANEMPPPSPSQCSVSASQLQEDELARIMDFEHRKKAAVKRYREGQLKIGKPSLNLGDLARIQRESGVGFATTNMIGAEQSSLQSFDSPNDESLTPFGSLFGLSPNKPHEETSRPTNPHRNRFLAASRALTLAYLEENPEGDYEAELGLSQVEDAATVPSTTMPFLSLSEDDPRAYFIKHRQDLTEQSGSKLTKTGLKIRRTKKTRFPFETIPVDSAVHNLIAVPTEQFIDIDSLQAICKTLSSTDGYVVSGQNHFPTWSPYGLEVKQWETKIHELITGLYRARPRGGEEVVPDLEIGLSRAFKALVDYEV